MCGYEQKLTRIYDYGYTYDKRGNLVKEEEICSPTTTGPKNITIATYLYDETNRMVRGTNTNSFDNRIRTSYLRVVVCNFFKSMVMFLGPVVVGEQISSSFTRLPRLS